MAAREGLLTYFTKGTITQEFLDDYELICEKVYTAKNVKWHLYDTFDEFYSGCLEKLPRTLAYYNKSKGALSTFLYSVVGNEYYRVYKLHIKYSHHEARYEKDDDNVDLVHQKSIDDKMALRVKLLTFAKSAYKKGIYIDQKRLLLSFLGGGESPIVKAFAWRVLSDR